MEKKKFRISRRSVALTLVLALLVGVVFMIPIWAAADTSALGGLIDGFTANNSVFALSSNSRFFLTEEPTGDLLQTIQLSQRQFAADGIPTETPMDIVWGDAAMLRSGDILIQIVSDDNDIGAEGYKLTVTTYATVAAKDVDGLLYGLNMLQKHFRNAGSTSIKGFTAYDTPDTKERTVQLDCARKYLTVEYVCNFIKEASWMGYNALQLHLSEDGGYRADLWDEDYYVEGEFEPENDFSWLCGSQVQSWVKDETDVKLPNYRNDPDAGKYLTTAELIQIFETCKEYHMEVIPSFDSPGHMDYITWKFEQNYLKNTSYSFTYNGTTYKASDTKGCINYNGTTGYSTPGWPYYTSIDIRDTTPRGKMAQAFVFAIYEDMADFFSYYAGSTKFNIGTDEVNLTSSYLTDEWSYSEFPGYVNELNGILNGKGYTCRMFNDFINDDNVSDFDSNIQILYWNSAYNSITGTSGAYDEPAVSSFVNNNRILYNCINQHTYYVLRVAPDGENGGDARSAYCRQWEFYGSDEDSIYNDWTPNNIRKKGVYTEPDAIVPDDQLGGAYFLTWHDYAAVNTETEIWNGVKDTVCNSGEIYSLRKRMWSNTIKQWNWDINSTLTFADYETIRDTLGDFPGLADDTYSDASYAKATSLPDATAPIHLADHTALTKALATQIEQGDYSDKTYKVYEDAYNAAVAVNNNNRATAEELGAALDSLNAAIDQLALPTNTFTVDRKTTINGTNYLIDTKTYDLTNSKNGYTIFVPAITGYTYLTTEGSTFTPLVSGDGSGYLTGTAVSDMTITIWYENTTDTGRLYTLLFDAITEQGSFTDSSWAAYTTALNNANNFSLTTGTRQSDVDTLVKALENAMSGLVVPSDTTTITAEKLVDSYNEGQKVGLYVYTTPNVANLTITNQETGETITPDSCSGEVQTLKSGEVVKYWLVFFTAQEAGTFTYTVSYDQTSDDVTVTVI